MNVCSRACAFCQMAAFGQQQSRLAEGQITQTIYGLIRDGKFGSAIEHLTQQLQVCRQHSRCTGCCSLAMSCTKVPKHHDRPNLTSDEYLTVCHLFFNACCSLFPTAELRYHCWRIVNITLGSMSRQHLRESAAMYALLQLWRTSSYTSPSTCRCNQCRRASIRATNIATCTHCCFL